jgi:hypothetical protein
VRPRPFGTTASTSADTVMACGGVRHVVVTARAPAGGSFPLADRVGSSAADRRAVSIRTRVPPDWDGFTPAGRKVVHWHIGCGRHRTRQRAGPSADQPAALGRGGAAPRLHCRRGSRLNLRRSLSAAEVAHAAIPAGRQVVMITRRTRAFPGPKITKGLGRSYIPYIGECVGIASWICARLPVE